MIVEHTQAETPMRDAGIAIRRLTRLDEKEIAQLADVLVDCVEGGASVSFMLPLSAERAASFWRGLSDDVAQGGRVLLVAEDEEGIVGTVQLVFATPENQPHRADIAKMLVHRRGRRRGVGARLMQAAEQAAIAAGRTVLVLDTVTGSDAERLYRRLGWTRVGEVPDYALWPQGGLCPTTFYCRNLA
jgi:GNAT superfamily N-acetyltransferase